MHTDDDAARSMTVWPQKAEEQIFYCAVQMRISMQCLETDNNLHQIRLLGKSN